MAARIINKLDLLSFDTNNAFNMTHMFYSCINLKEIKFKFNTENVINMSHMFYCVKI